MVSRMKQRKKTSSMRQSKRVSSANHLFQSIIQEQNQKQQNNLLLLRNQREQKLHQQRQKQVSFEIDSKSHVTESTSASSRSLQSEAPRSPSGPSHRQDKQSSINIPRKKQEDNNNTVFTEAVAAINNIDKRKSKSNAIRDKRQTSLQPERYDVNDLIRSNRSLKTENTNTKSEMREMKAKMTAMEKSLQRTQPEKEQQLLDAVEALHKVTTKQGEKIDAYKKSRKKLKAKIAQRDAHIASLEKEQKELKSARQSTEKEFQSMHQEVSSLQKELRQTLDYADECKAQLEQEKDINRDLTSRLMDLESQLQTLDIDTDRPTKHIKQIMKDSHYDTRSSTVSNTSQVMGHMAELEEKIKRTRREVS